jgi:uncharacterized protein YbaP (TraB family)
MKKLIILLMSICTGVVAVAQPSDAFTGALLWKISGKGLEKPSYIFGTHHLYNLSFFDKVPGAKAALESSEQVVGELLWADRGALAAQLQAAAMMPEGESYEKMLSPDDYKTLDEGLRQLIGVGLSDRFKVFKPGMISLMISQIIFAQANPGFNSMEHVALDVYVQNYATEKGEPVIGLETVEDEIHALFDVEPMKFQAEQLVCLVKNIAYQIESLKKLGENYAYGSLAALYTDSFNNPDDPCPTSEASQSALLKERNDKWLAKLPAIMSDKSSFIAVGALHLAGEEGLLYQLSKMGYTVTAVVQ